MASNAPVAQELWLAVAALGLERNRAAWARGYEKLGRWGMGIVRPISHHIVFLNFVDAPRRGGGDDTRRRFPPLTKGK